MAARTHGARTVRCGSSRVADRPGAMKSRARRFLWIAARPRGARRRGGARAQRVSVQPVFFFTPSQVAAKEAPQGTRVSHRRLVEHGSLAREPEASPCTSRHRYRADSPVTYTGCCPICFKRGQGRRGAGHAVAPTAPSHATEVLAKHDENYMPPDAKAIDKARGTMPMNRPARRTRPSA